MHMMRTICLLVIGAVLAALVGCAGAPPPPATLPGSLETPAELSRIAGWPGARVNSPDAFRFVVMGDRAGQPQPGVWEQAVEEINRLRPDFVMCVGDLVDGFKEDVAGVKAEWDEIDEFIRRLDAPFFYCPGNHDLGGIYRDYYTTRPGMKGVLWYSFNYRGCHFVVFDSIAMCREIPGIAERQWQWLEKDLAAARDARHIFIFEHDPLYGDQGDWMRFRKMLYPGKTTVFSGHEHSLSYAVEQGIPYFVLGPTGGFGGGGDPRKGGTHQFAHVTVSDAKPQVSIIPLGYVLPIDVRSRAVAALKRSAAWGATFTETTRAGGEITLDLPNATGLDVTYTLAWAGPDEWFAGKMPRSETFSLGPDKSARRTYRIARPTGPLVEAPALDIGYKFTWKGQEVSGSQTLRVFARADLTASRVAGITTDGKLDDWAAVPGRPFGARWQVQDNPKEWTGPEDCSATTRIGYDDKNLYFAVDVTDDTLMGEKGAQCWLRDSVEFFWDPRAPETRTIAFEGPCRQFGLFVPAEGEEMKPELGPAGAPSLPKVKAAVLRREGGYTVEAAVALDSIAEGFKPTPGTTLRIMILLNDRDEPGEKAKLACLSLCGRSDANKRTNGYAVLTFE